MRCTLCGLSELETILEKPAIPIFTNADDDSKLDVGKHSCILKQCLGCGHVFQPTSEKLTSALEKIYHSEQAQITTSLGVGNWGTERARYLFSKLGDVDEYKTKAVLEVGCGNGYVLKYLKNRGFRHLVGIEPSIKRTEEVGGILFLKEFITNDFELEDRFDLIFSFGVYEHIEDIDSITRFCNNHLNKGGKLFIYVPNCAKALTDADPAVFAHEHVQYFVPSSIKYHLSRHGYEVIDDRSDEHAITVYARKGEESKHEKYDIKSCKQFQNEIDKKLELVKSTLRDNKVVIHGACNSLNNILGWFDHHFDYTLVDNDNTKFGKTFFTKKVEPLSALDLANYDRVLIIPAYFANEIKAAYLKEGFRGEFVTLQSSQGING